MSDKPKLDLGVLEEDDEFEEFPVEGKYLRVMCMNCKICNDCFVSIKDWKDKDKDEQDISVWEDNWEDDNVEDDFNKQLRYVV